MVAKWPDGKKWKVPGVTVEEMLTWQRNEGNASTKRGALHTVYSKHRKSTLSIYKANDKLKGSRFVIFEHMEDGSKNQVAQKVMGEASESEWAERLEFLVTLTTKYANNEIDKKQFNEMKNNRLNGEEKPKTMDVHKDGAAVGVGKAKAKAKAKADKEQTDKDQASTSTAPSRSLQRKASLINKEEDGASAPKAKKAKGEVAFSDIYVEPASDDDAL